MFFRHNADLFFDTRVYETLSFTSIDAFAMIISVSAERSFIGKETSESSDPKVLDPSGFHMDVGSLVELRTGPAWQFCVVAYALVS